MRVLFLIPKNPPLVLEGNFSKAFKEFVALCLNKDPEERPTAKDLLKHRFIKAAKRTNQLVELIERRQRWLQVVGNPDSDEESDGGENPEGEDGVDWDFDTIKGAKGVPPSKLSASSDEPSKGAVKAVQQAERARSFSNPEVPRDAKAVPEKKSSPTPTPTPVPQEPKEAKENGEKSGSVREVTTRPSALTSVIYPVLSKLLRSNQEEGVISALAQLKIAFDNAERAKPGITHSLIAQIIETLKR
jgi:serine/threonine-protein kinase 24/25/MST4